MAAKLLSFAEFKHEVYNRIGGEVSKADIAKILAATAEELGDCLANGYKVNMSGIANFTPRVKAGRKKGTVVRNPFDGTTKTLRADEPDKVSIGVRCPAPLKNAMPSPKTAAGQALVKQLKRKK